MSTKISVERSQQNHYRLAPGFHLIPSQDHWLLYRPDGRFARLKLDPKFPAAAARLLAGEDIDSMGDEMEGLEHLFDALLAQDAIEPNSKPEGDVPSRLAHRSRVAIDGEGAVALYLMDLLRQEGFDVMQGLDVSRGLVEDSQAPSGEAPHLVVCCAGWLPDTRFGQRDAWCVEHGVAWHGVYGEGTSFYLGPFWLPDDARTVRYEDARARRLAADALPDGLEDYWRYLDAGHRVPDFEPPTAAEAARVAGALAQDISAWSAGQTPPSHGHQLAFDRSTGQWRRHPVLPVPRGLMTERIP